mmetsp:Transcript_36192/g.115891  ORF Transcript_36192/g.115891 Transcript_36192/m.115891 type:complete len:243 (+) Transcript_36192:397-1125(+)
MPHIFKSSPLSQHRARAPRALLFTRLACSLSYSTHACGACSGVDLIRMRVCSRSLPRYGAVLVAVWMTRRLDQATKSPTRQRCLSSRPSSSPGAHAAATYAFASSKPSVRPRERRAATWYEPTRARFPLTFSLQTSGTEVPSARLTSQLSSVSPFEPLAHRRDVPSRATSYCAKRRYCTLTSSGGGSREGGSSSAALTLQAKSVSPPSSGVTRHLIVVRSGGGSVSARPSQCHARWSGCQPL